MSNSTRDKARLMALYVVTARMIKRETDNGERNRLVFRLAGIAQQIRQQQNY